MKTYLVTGAAGFIGANYIKYLLEKKYQDEDIKVIVLDLLTYAGNLGTIKNNIDDKRCVFVRGDIRDRDLVNGLFADNDIDYVVNFAAESHVDRSIEDPQLFLSVNILGTQNLLDAARKAWVPGNDETGSPTWKVGKRYHQVMPINITRCSNNYGPYHFPEKLIPLIINNILEGKKLPVYGKGENVRDWLYVEDHCKAIDLVVREGRVGEVYNVGGHNEMKNIDIVKLVIKTIRQLMDGNKDLRRVLKKQELDANGEIRTDWINEDLITYVADRLGHDQRYGIDPTKIKNELGWYPETKFADGIVKTIEWNLANQEWIAEVTSGDYQKYYEEMYGNR